MAKRGNASKGRKAKADAVKDETIRDAMRDGLPKLLTCVIAFEAIGAAGSLATALIMPNWFGAIGKPFFSPPMWLFVPVLLLVYLIMGASAYLIWKRHNTHVRARVAIAFFLIQLMVSLVWLFLFFGQQSAIGAFTAVAVLWIATIATFVWFWHISRRISMLMLPYLAWVIFAMLVNIYIIFLNLY